MGFKSFFEHSENTCKKGFELVFLVELEFPCSIFQIGIKKLLYQFKFTLFIGRFKQKVNLSTWSFIVWLNLYLTFLLFILCSRIFLLNGVLISEGCLSYHTCCDMRSQIWRLYWWSQCCRLFTTSKRYWGPIITRIPTRLKELTSDPSKTERTLIT